MVDAMTPSKTVVTAGQIGKIQELLGAALRKSGLPSDPMQQVLEREGEALATDMLVSIRKRVETMSNIVVRRVNVDRTRTPQEVPKATGRNLYVNDNVVNAMPKGEGDKAEIRFFKLDRYVSDTDLDKEYKLRGLKPADPYSLAAANEADPSFADNYPNGTHWKDAAGKWCYAAFRQWRGERSVWVDRHVFDWHGGWWFAGLRK